MHFPGEGGKADGVVYRPDRDRITLAIQRIPKNPNFIGGAGGSAVEGTVNGIIKCAVVVYINADGEVADAIGREDEIPALVDIDKTGGAGFRAFKPEIGGYRWRLGWVQQPCQAIGGGGINRHISSRRVEEDFMGEIIGRRVIRVDCIGRVLDRHTGGQGLHRVPAL